MILYRLNMDVLVPRWPVVSELNPYYDTLDYSIRTTTQLIYKYLIITKLTIKKKDKKRTKQVLI